MRKRKRKKKQTRYEELFGSPEKAANTLDILSRKCYFGMTECCDGCPIYDICRADERSAAEWLNSD